MDGSEFLRRMRMGPQEQGRVLAELQPFVVRKVRALLARFRRSLADDVLDVVQDVNERILRNWPQFDGQGPLEAWIGRIARNRVIDLWRPLRDVQFIDLDADENTTASDKLSQLKDRGEVAPPPDFFFERSCLGLALATLSAAPPARKGSMRAYDLIAYLVDAMGPDAEELAEFLNTTRHAAVERRSQVLKKLREVCERVCGRDDCDLPVARSAR